MKVLIIGGTKGDVTQEVRAYYQKYIDFFKKSASTVSADAIIESTLLDDLIVSVGDDAFTIYDTHNKRELSEFDVLFLRGDGFRSYMDMIGAINEYAHLHGKTIINDYSNVRDSSKLLQAVHFHKIGVPVARTIFVTSGVLNNEDRLSWSFPCIMKATHGSHGNDNYVVNSMDEVRAVLERQADKRFVLQRFVPNNGDYRILIIGDEVLVIGRLAAEGSHLNNTSKGGGATLIDRAELPEVVIENAKRIMQHFGMTIGGVDALADKGTNEFFFLEVNAQPQLMSGAFVEEKAALMGKLLDKLSQ